MAARTLSAVCCQPKMDLKKKGAQVVLKGEGVMIP